MTHSRTGDQFSTEIQHKVVKDVKVEYLSVNMVNGILRDVGTTAIAETHEETPVSIH